MRPKSKVIFKLIVILIIVLSVMIAKITGQTFAISAEIYSFLLSLFLLDFWIFGYRIAWWNLI